MNEVRIREVTQSILEQEELFLVDIVIKGNQSHHKLIVLADGDEGISIDQCGKVSRQLGSIIEEEDLISEKYTLEVSSPGLDFPLTIGRQYTKNVGRILDVVLNNGEQIEGELVNVDKNKISLKVDNLQQDFSFDNIKQSKVKISFK